MPRESDLLNPLAGWFRDQFGSEGRLLIHEEPQGRGGRRPDMLLVVGTAESESVRAVRFFPVEIEVSSRGALHDRRNGLAQLRKYPGHAKYLAIPKTVAARSTAREIPGRCANQGVGYLVVDLDSVEVDCQVNAQFGLPERQLTTYPVATDRWLALRDSTDTYRRISGRRIIERD